MKTGYTFKITDNSDHILRVLQGRTEKILEMWGIEVEKQAKLELGKSPQREDTGLLRNSITYALGGKPPKITGYRSNGVNKHGKSVPVKTGSYSGSAPMGVPWKQYVYIGTNVKYAQYAHNGTRKMQPNRFIVNAVNNSRGTLQNIAKDVLDGKL